MKTPIINADVHCYFEQDGKPPLIVSPVDFGTINFCEWAPAYQTKITEIIKNYGAIVFRGFDLSRDQFSEAVLSATGISPQPYKGDTPRNELGTNIYTSTAVASGHTLPLHQEVSAGNRADMPQYLSFYCATAPKPGTGQTLLGNAREVTEAIQAKMPALWARMTSQTLTYSARYLPNESWRTHWIRWLNPSHATIEKQFGSENREEIEKKCRQEGLDCRWDDGWVVVTRSGIPATIDVEGTTLFCNQVHVDKLNPKLCGGWLPYMAARLLLYPTEESKQFDVQFDDGTQISPDEASQLLSILEEHQMGRDWVEGDLLILDNAKIMHGKTPHEGDREIIVAMCGSVTHFSEGGEL